MINDYLKANAKHGKVERVGEKKVGGEKDTCCVRERQRLKTVKGLCFFYPHGLSSLAGPNHLFPSFYYLSSFEGKFLLSICHPWTSSLHGALRTCLGFA